jgi:hypothetical protein
MANIVEAAFNLFYERINLTGDHRDVANSRRDRVVSLLKKDFEIVDAFSTGSIPKFTALQTHADLDVMVVLNYGKHIKNKTPVEVLENIRSSLSEYRTNVRKNGQAVTLHYESWPNVDIVPVCRVTNNDGGISHYEVPQLQNWRMDQCTATQIRQRDRGEGERVRPELPSDNKNDQAMELGA